MMFRTEIKCLIIAYLITNSPIRYNEREGLAHLPIGATNIKIKYDLPQQPYYTQTENEQNIYYTYMLCINIGLQHKIMHYMKPFASVIDINIYLNMQLWCTTRSLLKLYCNTNINMIIKITTINRIMNRPILKRPPSELD